MGTAAAQSKSNFKICDYPVEGGYRCAVRVWKVDDPIARVVFVHGIISHSGWYFSSCEFLAANGVEVHFIDRRGSGLNEAARGDVDVYQTWFYDLVAYIESLPLDRPKLLGGISWGGKLVAAFSKYYPGVIDAVAMICPGLYAKQQAKWWQRAVLKMLGLLGAHSLRITIPLQDPRLFTQTPEYLKYIAEDPLTLRKITVRFALADLKLNDDARLSAKSITMPVLMMLSGQDMIVNNHATKLFYNQISTSNKQLLEYPEYAHTFEFETDPQPYFEDLLNWILSVSADNKMQEQVSTVI